MENSEQSSGETPTAGRADFPRPTPDAARLLATWMEWERGESTPGRVMADLKHGGLPDLLRSLAEG